EGCHAALERELGDGPRAEFRIPVRILERAVERGREIGRVRIKSELTARDREVYERIPERHVGQDVEVIHVQDEELVRPPPERAFLARHGERVGALAGEVVRSRLLNMRQLERDRNDARGGVRVDDLREDHGTSSLNLSVNLVSPLTLKRGVQSVSCKVWVMKLLMLASG